MGAGGGRGAGGGFRRDPDQAFARLDENGDGKVTKAEFKDAMDKMHAQAAAKAGGSAASGGAPGGGGQGQAGGGRPRMAPDRFFARLDTNGDGVITKDEFKAAIANMRPPGGGGGGGRMRGGPPGGGPGGAPPAGGATPAGGGSNGGG